MTQFILSRVGTLNDYISSNSKYYSMCYEEYVNDSSSLKLRRYTNISFSVIELFIKKIDHWKHVRDLTPIAYVGIF